MTISRGDVVLLDLPYSDLTGVKLRPALVVSNASYHAACGDAIVQAITSQTETAINYPGASRLRSWRQAGLVFPSALKGVLFTADRRLIQRRLGRLDAQDLQAADAALLKILFD